MLIVDVVVTCGAHFEGNPPSSYLVFSTNGKFQYCPVFEFEKTRGLHNQYLYPDQYGSPTATVAKSSVLYSASYEGVSAFFEWKPLDGWNTKEPFMVEKRISKIEERKKNFLQEFDRDLSLIFPRFRFDLESAAVFTDVTEEKPPRSFLEEGMLVVWNDKYLPRNNPARKHCGEGPFLVIWDNNHIASFHVTYDKDSSISDVHTKIKPRDYRVILKCPDEDLLISVHGGYLRRMAKYRQRTGHVLLLTDMRDLLKQERKRLEAKQYMYRTIFTP